MEISYLGDHLRYTAWATRRTLEAVGELTDEEFTRDLQCSFGNVRGTLLHMLEASSWWYSVLTDEDSGERVDDDAPFPEIRDAYLALLHRYERLADQLQRHGDAWSFATTEVTVHVGEIRKWQGIMNIVSHDTYHRGQIATLLRQMGHQPVETDIIYFYSNK